MNFTFIIGNGFDLNIGTKVFYKFFKMVDIEELIGKTGEFYLINECVEGTLLHHSSGTIALNTRIDRKQYQWLENEKQITGYVFGTKITLLRAFLASSESIGAFHDDTERFIHAELIPSEIILGEKYSDSICISEIKASSAHLNRYIPVKSDSGFDMKRDGFPYVIVNKTPYIVFEDDNGKVEIYSQFGIAHNDLNHIPYINRTCFVSRMYCAPVLYQEGRQDVYRFRNMISFFFDGYVKYDTISFLDINGNECVVVNNYEENNQEGERTYPIVAWSYIEKDIQKIWLKWKGFSEVNDGVVSLFYEIVTGSSVRLNRFLNITQIIDIFSQNQREQEVKAARRECDKYVEKDKRSKDVILKHRLFDLIYYSDVFGSYDINSKMICYLSGILADARNYYTHYNSKRMRKPSYEEIFIYSYFLRCTMLRSIYKYLGISLEKIVFPKEYRDSIKRLYWWGLEESKEKLS